ncbi:hypothetical protein HF086_011336, partial [Spodoptera exigua]
MDEEASGEDLSDEEILQKCEQQLNEMRNTEVNRESGNEINEGELRLAEKRKEREDDHSDDGFITVIRRKPKRFIRSDSVDVNNGKEKDKEGTYMQIVNHERFDNTPSTAITTTDKESYRDVLTRVVVHQQPVSDMDEDEEEEDNRVNVGIKVNTKTPKQKATKKLNQTNKKTNVSEVQKKKEDKDSAEKEKERSRH